MKKKLTARELELHAVNVRPARGRPPAPLASEAMAMLVRRGLGPEKTSQDTPFAHDIEDDLAEELADWLGHYAFRLFLRGAIQKSGSFRPEETTRYLTRERAHLYAQALVDMGLARKISPKNYMLKWRFDNFGSTLEWYVAHELKKRFAFDVATGVKLHTRGAGGDLDIVAAAEGKLVYIELKSSPPRNLSSSEVASFCDRVNLLRPDLSLFVIDTALRLSDKVLPMLMQEFRQRGLGQGNPRRIANQVWELTAHVYAVNGQRDLMANIGKAIAAGFLALSPFSGGT